MRAEAEAKFVVIVDIKRPDADLVGKDKYRNKVYPLGEDLIGGASQVQSYCRTWVIDGSRQEDTVADLLAKGIFTVEPRGILVVGNSAQLDDPDKRTTFELYRRNLRNPEVLTYDELLSRAEHTLAFNEIPQNANSDGRRQG
jgi:hypothetical protein